MKRFLTFIAALFFGLSVFVPVVSAQDEPKEPQVVLQLPTDVIVDRQQNVGGLFVEILTYENDNKVAFSSVYVSNRNGIGYEIGFADGFSSVSSHTSGELDENGNLKKRGIVEEVALERYYSKRYDDELLDFGRFPDWELALKKASLIFEADPLWVLGRFITIGDKHLAIVNELLKSGGLQKQMEFLLRGYAGLYKAFREENLPFAKFSEDSRAVSSRGKLPTTWAAMKKTTSH